MLSPNSYPKTPEILPVKPRIILRFFILFAMLSFPPASFAEGKHAGMEDAEAKVCFGCHKDLAETPPGEHVHAPFAEGECTSCHELADDGTFKLMDSGDDPICYMCHDPKNTKKIVHAPVASGDCIMCHSPHQSPNEYQLLDSPVSNLCFNCHDDDKTNHKFVHAPVAGGECTSCHDPHESDYENRLKADGKDLCLMCHDDKAELLEKKEHVHDAIEMVGCTGCHSPHGSEHKYQLLNTPPDLCFDCHSDIQEIAEGAKTPHGALKLKGSCIRCHDPHASDFDKQLKKQNMELCLTCHNRKRKTPTGWTMNMEKHLKENPEHHGPILMEECTPCHSPHGSNNWRMLRRKFPSTFYAPFKEENYALCFGCHDKELVTSKLTSSDTGFRNGEKNLHFVHVGNPEKGRRCVVCHDVHGSKGPKHIRESALFGTWHIPINFTINDDGGKCAPGCHFPRAYNRKHAVENR